MAMMIKIDKINDDFGTYFFESVNLYDNVVKKNAWFGSKRYRIIIKSLQYSNLFPNITLRFKNEDERDKTYLKITLYDD